MSGPDGGDRLHAGEIVRERLDAGCPQRVELLSPRGEDIGRLVLTTNHPGPDALLRRDVDLRDLQLALAPGRGEHDLLAPLAAEESLADR